jgi:hypothetical protein
MQIDSSTDTHTATLFGHRHFHMQFQGCDTCGEVSGQLKDTWALGVDRTGPDRTGLDTQTLQLSHKLNSQLSVNYTDRLKGV